METLAAWQDWARSMVTDHPDLLTPIMPLIDPEIDKVMG